MARTPWAIIKQCLPCWLVESAPYKQAFIFFLAVLSPSLFLSPFLLSPLLTLFLLSSATMAGALSAWMTMKVTRTVLKHSSPLPMPLTLSSCFKSLLQIMKLHFCGSMMITNKFPWIWLWFFKILASSESKDVATKEERGATLSSKDSFGECASEQEDFVIEAKEKKKLMVDDSITFLTKEESIKMGVGHVIMEEGREQINESLSKPEDEKQLLAKIRDAAPTAVEAEKFSIVELERGGSSSVYFRGAMLGARGLRAKKDVHYSLQVLSKDSSKTSQTEKKTEMKKIEVGGEFQIVSQLDTSAGSSEIKADVAEDGDHSVLHGQSRMRRLHKQVEAGIGPMKFISQDDQTMNMGQDVNIGGEKVSKGCSSHKRCQKGLNLEEELHLLVEDIHTVCLGKWYPDLSSSETFPSELKILLDICVRHVAFIGARSDMLALALKLASIFLCHLREFRRARRKKRAAEAMAYADKAAEIRKSEYSVSTESVFSEEKVSSMSPEKSASTNWSPRDVSSQTSPLEEPESMVIHVDISSSSPEKSLVAMEGSSDKRLGSPPSLVFQSDSPSPKTRSSTASAKKTFSIENHVGEEVYYRLRFGHSNIKDVPGHYLINVSMYIVRDFISLVSKLPADPLEKHYFRDCGSSLADSSPGKILVSIIARKILLPLVETVSDPEWLNLRIATLLVEHARAKVQLDSSDENVENRLFFSSGVHCVTNTGSGSATENSFSDAASSPCSLIKSEQCEELCERSEETGSREERRKSLSLPLEVSGSGLVNPIDSRISSVLGGIISATAGPLLPDNVGVSYKPIKRMWSSPSVEEGKELDEEPEYKKKVRHFGQNIIDGLPVISKTILEGSAPSSGQEVVYKTDEKGHVTTFSLSGPKDSHETSSKKTSLASTDRKLTKVHGALPHSGLFRSKSSHDVQAANEESWHIEEGSELHEDVYLSDDPGSPVAIEKETWESSARKTGRSRSFHGVKNYNRYRDNNKDKSSREQSPSVMEGKKETLKRNDTDSLLQLSSKGEKSVLRVSSEGSMREGRDKVFHAESDGLSQGLGARWVRYALGKRGTLDSSEGDSDDLNQARSSSCQSSEDKGEKGSAVSSRRSFSEEYVSPDVFRADEKLWNTREGAGKTLINNKGVIKAIHGSEIDPDGGKETTAVDQSFPSPSFGMADDNVKDITKDISPVYEEVEDLPSTIAKLKALLRERNGGQQTEESAPSSVEEMKKEIENLPQLDATLDQDGTEDLRAQSSPLEERPFSWPSDGGIFLNVRIPYTEICKGMSTSQFSSSSPHVYYCIEYDAAYPEEGADAAMISLASEDSEGLAVEVVGSHPDGTGHKDTLAVPDIGEMFPPSPGTMVHHIVVKRQFQEFLDLQAQLEADPLWRQALKGLKGPSRWLSLPFGKTSASTVAGRRTLLQAYLRGVCTTMPQLASCSKALRTFMGYQGISKPVASGETLPSSVERVLPIAAEGGEGPVPRIDKLFARTMSGMFNTLKTALPGFDSPETTQLSSGAPSSSSSSTPLPPSITSSHPDSSSAPATLGETKFSIGQSGTIRGTMIQLPAFLQFGNSSTATYPELVDWDMEYNERNAGGSITASGSTDGIPAKSYSLEEDVLALLESISHTSDANADPAEFAYEALIPFDSDEEQPLSSPLRKDLTNPYLVDSADEDDEEEELDAFLPLSKIAIDILCEALRGTGSWVSQGTVVHATKVLIGSIFEHKLQDFLKAVTTKEMWCHYIHILRIALFHNNLTNSCHGEGLSEETRSNISGEQLAVAMYTALPSLFKQFIGNQELSEAAKFIADSLQNKIILRELVMQVLHVCVVNLISLQNKSKEVN